jgi:hypothetical protein
MAEERLTKFEKVVICKHRISRRFNLEISITDGTDHSCYIFLLYNQFYIVSTPQVVSSLHHMLSTGTCAGVYNSPYDQMAPATVYGLPVEEHLRNVARGTLRQQILKKSSNGDCLCYIY